MLRNLAIALILTGAAWGQGACFPGQALTSRQGFSNLAAVVPAATITVSPGPVFTDQTDSTVVTQPIVADFNGNYQICAAGATTQTVTVSGPNMGPVTYKLTFPSLIAGATLAANNVFTGNNTFGSILLAGASISTTNVSMTINAQGTTGTGPNLSLFAGNGGAGVNNGGNIILQPGSGTGGGVNGNILFNGPIVASGTTAGLTGTGACATFTGQAGGVFAGVARCTGATGAATVIITPGFTAPNGWICYIQDETTRANLLQETGHTATTCTLTSTNVTNNDVFVFQAIAF